MPTWEDIQDFLRAHYRVVDDDEQVMGVLIEFQDRRRQHISISRFQAFDKDWISFETRICQEPLLDPAQACRLNAELAVGSLALDGEGFYVARHTALLDTLDLDDLIVPLHALTSLADDLEEKLTGRDIW